MTTQNRQKSNSEKIIKNNPTFALKIEEIQYIYTFKQMLAVCIYLTNFTGSNHEEVSTNRDTLLFGVFFVCVLV